MIGIALKMLFGDSFKLLGLVLGLAFSTLLISQQSGIFVGLLSRTTSVIQDIPTAQIWVMDPGVEYIDTIRPMRDTALSQVRGVGGVAWAVPFFKAQGQVRNSAGVIKLAQILGVDDASMIGLPGQFLLGRPEDLRRPDAIAVDAAGFRRLWPDAPQLDLGRELELNDRRAVVVAIVNASAPFMDAPVLFTRYTQAIRYVATGRNQLSFILASPLPGETAAAVAARIQAQTGLAALTQEAWTAKTMNFIIANTGIPINFGAVVLLGIIVGIAVVALTFSMFILENVRQFAALKAIGVTNGQIVTMVLTQAGVVGLIGYALGLGAAALFFDRVPQIAPALRGFWLPWQVAAGMAALATVIMILSTLAGLRRVLIADPAQVFRG